ncbi:TadE/TadG family type IV pilus assembly protein [Phenylobacterium sp.]|jgi:Flp pilus assembly protein TadG|uniref:TadE/TadG family type IV pilus assembly protein n=1 Tax=Phenylobacterium sp. TaxID=1871053 RepID=UPI002F92DC8B
MRAFWRSAAGRLARDRKGAAMVEFALVAPIFLGLLLATFELGILGMMSANFNGAVDSVSRRIRTGQADRPNSAAEFRNLICAKMVDTVANCQSRVLVTVQPVDAGFSSARSMLQAQDPNNLTGQQAYDPGDPEQIILVTATYRWPMALPFLGDAFPRDTSGRVQIVSRIAFRNEPFE